MKIVKSKELKSKREELFEKQKGIDPILGISIVNQVLDHDHSSGNIRMVIDREINQFVGKCESAYIRFLKWKNIGSLPNILRGVAKYLDQDYSQNDYHPNHALKMQRKFKNLKKEFQDLILKEAGLIPGKTKQENLKYYKKLIKQDDK